MTAFLTPHRTDVRMDHEPSNTTGWLAALGGGILAVVAWAREFTKDRNARLARKDELLVKHEEISVKHEEIADKKDERELDAIKSFVDATLRRVETLEGRESEREKRIVAVEREASLCQEKHGELLIEHAALRNEHEVLRGKYNTIQTKYVHLELENKALVMRLTSVEAAHATEKARAEELEFRVATMSAQLDSTYTIPAPPPKR